MRTSEAPINSTIARFKSLVGGDLTAGHVFSDQNDPDDPDEVPPDTSIIFGPTDHLDALEAFIGIGDPTSFAVLTRRTSWQELHGRELRQERNKGFMRFFKLFGLGKSHLTP